MPDGRFHDILESTADRGQSVLWVREVKICRCFLGIGNAPCGEAGDFDSLILGRDLVGLELDGPCGGGNDRVTINPWQFEETDAATGMTYLSHSLVDRKFGRAGIDDPDGFHLFVFHKPTLPQGEISG